MAAAAGTIAKWSKGGPIVALRSRGWANAPILNPLNVSRAIRPRRPKACTVQALCHQRYQE